MPKETRGDAPFAREVEDEGVSAAVTTGDTHFAADAASAVLAVVITTTVLTYAAMTALFPAAMAPELAAALGVPAAVVGLQISLVYAGAMITSLLGGALTRRMGACRASQIALLLLGGGAALAAAPTLATFALASLMMGLGYGLTNPAASHLLMRFAPAGRRGLIFSVKQSGVPLGGVLAGVCAPSLALMVGWQWALLSLVLLAVAAALLLQTRRASWDRDRDPRAKWMRSPFADIHLVWSNRPLRYLSLAGLCFACVQLCLSAFTVTLLVEDLQVGLLQAGLVMSAVQAAGVGGRLLWGWIADLLRSAGAALVMVTSITVAGAVATSLMTPEWPFSMAAITLCVLGFSALGWNGVYLAEVARLAPAGRVASASGGSLFFTFSGVLFGPPAFTALHLLLDSYAHVFAVLAAAAAVGLVFVVAAGRPATNPQEYFQN